MKKRFLAILLTIFLATSCYAGQLLPYPKFKATDSVGVPYSGGKLYTYIQGTTTAKAAYTDVNLTSAATNPIVLDANGEAAVYLKGKYKLVLKTSADVTVWTLDNVQGMGDWEEGKYYVDAAETDQGVTGTGNSIAAFLATIGSKNAILKLSNTNVSGTTSYTVSTSITVPANVKLDIDPGARLVKGSGSPTVTINGTISHTIKQIFSGWSAGNISFGPGSVDSVFPQWWGAVGDGTTDSTVAIQCALDSGENVLILPGTYKISASLTWSGRGSFLGNGVDTIFRPTSETFPAFISYAELVSHKELGRFQIDYGTATGNAKSTNANAIGLKIINGVGTTFPYQFNMHDIWVSYANYAYSDDSSAWGYSLTRIYAYKCTHGFYKHMGTTVTMTLCFADNCTYAFELDTVMSPTLINCGFNGATGTADKPGQAYFKACHGLSIIGFDVEGNTQSVTGQAIVYLDNCDFIISGFRTYANVLATGAANEIAIVKLFNGAWGVLSGVTLGSADSYTGTGTAASVIIGGGSYGDLLQVGGGVVNIIATGSGGTSLSAKVASDSTLVSSGSLVPIVTNAGRFYAFDLNGVKLNGGISTYLDNATAVANGLTVGQIYKTSDGSLMVVY